MIRPQPLDMKRGTIHLYKIRILFLDREFEHDVYELIWAIPPCKVKYIQFTKKKPHRKNITFPLLCQKKTEALF